MHMVGDPTLYPGFDPHPIVLEAIRESLDSKRCNGYGPAHGIKVTLIN